MRRTGFLVLALLALAGCAAVGRVPAPAGGQNAASPATTGTPEAESGSTAAASAVQGASAVGSSGAAPSDESQGPSLESLANRLTLMQEQLIQLKAQGAEISQQSETALARLQMLTGQSANNVAAQDGPVSESAVPAESPQQLASLIDQLSGIANELQLSGVGDSYRIVADYTGSGQWVLVRYDRFSGETWLADHGIWQPLSDPLPLSRSDYDVQLTRADNDIKGYVAARLDKRNGDTWWLKQDAWQKFE